MMKYIILFFILMVTVSCETQQAPSAQDIIDKAIAKAGGERYYNSKIEFDFRDKNYCAVRDQGDYKLERLSIKDSIVTTDILANSYFLRLENEQRIALADTLADNIANSVNSVHYFSVLPYGLNAEAVHKKYLGVVTLKSQRYYKIQVTFVEEGGGTDFDDVFLYWINTDNYKVDYLAYEYHTDGGGMRFREAYNERVINGIRFVDYNNYKPSNKTIKLDALEALFEASELELLSKIELENVRVETCSNC